MKITRNLLVLSAALVAGLPAWAADETAALDIAKKNGCLACHGMETKMVGPSWRDVGKKYAGDAEAEDRLVVKVKKGGKGVWGQVPMPPNVTVNDADVRTLVKFVLTLK